MDKIFKVLINSGIYHYYYMHSLEDVLMHACAKGFISKKNVHEALLEMNEYLCSSPRKVMPLNLSSALEFSKLPCSFNDTVKILSNWNNRPKLL